jgi:hypothetical protein
VPVELVGWIPQTGAVGLLLVALFWAVMSGRIVPRATHEEVRRDRDVYRAAAESALDASREMSSHVGRLVSAVEQLTAAQRESLDLLHRMVPASPPDDRMST